ncbi:MAG: phosphoribosylanthranilate isomerase [Lachnospiraceae bacterium]|nr:phosphoribosylanthranilate isomerase [Lachnospiraceae bacterium]
MTKIKLCGLTRACDIEVANTLKPEYIGFVFWEKSKRNISAAEAQKLRQQLVPEIQAVGVFVDPELRMVAELLNQGVIQIAQLHGREDEDYIRALRQMAPGKPIIKAYKVRTPEDVKAANESTADGVLLDSGTGSGQVFDWQLLKDINRPYFLAGGLTTDTVHQAVQQLKPYAVDVSSGIETEGLKDPDKMKRFVEAVRSVRE